MEADMQQLKASARRWETRALLGEAALAKARRQAAERQIRVEALEIVATDALERAAKWQAKAEGLETAAAEAGAKAVVWQTRAEELKSAITESEAQLQVWRTRAKELERDLATAQAQARSQEQARLAAEARAAEEIERICRTIRDERWFSFFFAALVIVWTGVVVLVSDLADAAGADVAYTAAWVATGAGLLLWIEALLRSVVPAYRARIAERVVLGMVLIIVGLGQLADLSLWPLLLVAIGILALASRFGVETQRI
jgi:hypothetical protein